MGASRTDARATSFLHISFLELDLKPTPHHNHNIRQTSLTSDKQTPAFV